VKLPRTGVVGAVVLFAVILQVAVFNLFSVNGVVPNLVLLVVVAAAIARGPQFGAVVGFAGGMLLDLAPPAEHVAGRWALALVLVAILAGRVRSDARRSPLAGLATVAVCSFIATSVFALSGAVLGDHALPVGEMVQVIGIALLWDVVVAPLLLPGLMGLFERTRPAELAY
jgi:rod shape-determining protein MreD